MTTETEELVDLTPEQIYQQQLAAITAQGFDNTIHDLIDNDAPLKGYELKLVAVIEKPKIALTDVSVVAEKSEKVGDIWWIPTKTPFVLTANVGLQDSRMMVIIEQVIRLEDGTYNPVNDKRIPADIINGVVTIKGKFESDGNYRITQERLNMGLDEIGAPFNLNFDLIEFDAYEV
ncbi:hypothetical protein KO527_05475 [Pseudoalteromonas sp. C2R02]|uniref:hypothetical protein n=1 Tax=Pseudoalteromonas sp. C2R02 TaxID=2841565 RepID=UPI001C092AF2|nr:hypothetical protein [Pseudoalteromonas sp. C2R02]MBU2968799.1 hypothetical protein [Pseudoalteromonas sp. C2R02]